MLIMDFIANFRHYQVIEICQANKITVIGGTKRFCVKSESENFRNRIAKWRSPLKL